jgi:hypothetical protein
VACSLLYACHLAGDVGGPIPDRWGHSRRDVPIGERKRFPHFRILDADCLSMGTLSFLFDRIIDPGSPPQSHRLSPLPQRDKILSVPKSKGQRANHLKFALLLGLLFCVNSSNSINSINPINRVYSGLLCPMLLLYAVGS